MTLAPGHLPIMVTEVGYEIIVYNTLVKPKVPMDGGLWLDSNYFPK